MSSQDDPLRGQHALVAYNQGELEEKVQLWQRALADNGLRLNVKNTLRLNVKNTKMLKCKLYRAVVRPALLYGSECWALGKAQERQLHAAEMRMLKWACRWTRQDKVRNEDVRAVKAALIQLEMRKQRLRWYGHVLRRPENHPIRLALDFEAPGKRPRGAPRKRWKDVIKSDLAEIVARQMMP
ncbi:unnamed protein product [Heligmosomoides polygyrus]|uniref:Reverse transcriptase n=1 Tax=Heligmosomoides polygyrus TaxID=6339 RepID=A0A183GII9_HELPZ|nr:unnamed protein product [Heligmosomoides polygyrus]